MKKLAIALAIAVLAASPAFAKSKHPQKDMAQTVGEAADAYAYVPADQSQPRLRGEDTPQLVYAVGLYQGADPDPNIRFQLLRDPPKIQ